MAVTDSSARAKGIFSTKEVILTDVDENVAEDADAAQPEVSARRTEADATSTPTAIACTREETVRHA